MPLPAVESWVKKAVAESWRGARPGSITVLKGDASGRRFWRIRVTGAGPHVPSTAIAVDLGPDDLPLYARALGLMREPPPEPPFINVHRFLKSIGAAVPELYYARAGERMLLVEDVGEVALFDAAVRTPGKAASLYRPAVDELMLLHCEGTRRPDRRCVAFSLVYDERLFRWELDHFAEFGLPAVAREMDVALLTPELDRLAAELGALPRVFSHRDYHGHNLFVADGKIRLIDFQDALMAPHAQDLAVLLTTRDTSRVITPAAERRLLHYYLAGLERRDAASLAAADFMQSYWLCVLQHALKVIGRFVWLEQQGMPGYEKYIPFAIAQGRRALAVLDDFPALRQALQAEGGCA